MKQRIAALEDIPLAKFVSVYSKFTRHKSHMRFNCEFNVKIAGPSHYASGDEVRVDLNQLNHRKRNKIITISFTRARKIASNVYFNTALRSAIKNSFQFSRP